MTRHPWVAQADRGLRWGVQLIVPAEHDALPRLIETGRMVEDLGYDALFVFDHPSVHADPWIALAGLATATSRVRLGSAVNCAWYRHPAYLARLAADLDNLSGGRLILGVGSGWMESEFRALDVPFLPIPARQSGLDEALTIVQGVWGPEPFSYAGTHFRVEAMQVTPPPRQRPRPPILIGGSGERKTLRQVARFGDACNVREATAITDGTVSHEQRAAAVRRKYDALRAHCAELGRPADEVLRTHFTLYLVLAPTAPAVAAKLDLLDTSRSTSPGTRRDGKVHVFGATPDQAADYYRAIAAAGTQYFVVQLDGTDHETIRLLAEEVAPRVAGA
ncbi:MAG TPA: LLM class flavin-dependent oxidoreductase [Thermomicrobiales bacterium]|jgi:alkanesulfonate monooxygenase SsuD/methylene tetrahydromethanopterin reductase-like flavin-dependent oxidoreductase (luciferase family)